MVFTNDDLKRLKSWLIYCENKFNGHHLDNGTFFREMSYTEVKTFLARLEAAEAFIYHSKLDDYSKDWYEAWRKSCGL